MSSVIDNYIYNDNETSITKYNLVLCELSSLGNNNEDNIFSFIVLHRYRLNNIEDTFIHMNYMYNYLRLYIANIIHQNNSIRNYNNILRNTNYFKPQIAECILLESGYYLAILKTHWLKIIQRKWKKIIYKRSEIMLKRRNIQNILYRQTYGKWPSYLIHLPTIKGMLADLTTSSTRATS